MNKKIYELIKYNRTPIKIFNYDSGNSWWNSNGWVSGGYTGDGTGANSLGARWSGGTSYTSKSFPYLKAATIHLKQSLWMYYANDEGAYRHRFRIQAYADGYTCNNGFQINSIDYGTIVLKYGTNVLNTGINIYQPNPGANSSNWWIVADITLYKATVKLYPIVYSGVMAGDGASWLAIGDNTSGAPAYIWTIDRGGNEPFDGNCLSFMNTQPTGGTYADITQLNRPHELFLTI